MYPMYMLYDVDGDDDYDVNEAKELCDGHGVYGVYVVSGVCGLYDVPDDFVYDAYQVLRTQ